MFVQPNHLALYCFHLSSSFYKKEKLRLQWNQYFEKSFLHHRYNFRMLSFCVCFFKHFYIFHRCISLHPYGLQCWYFFFPYMRSYTKDTWAYGPNINVYVTIARIHQVSLICEGAPSFYQITTNGSQHRLLTETTNNLPFTNLIKGRYFHNFHSFEKHSRY